MDGTPPGLRLLSMSQTTFCKRHSGVETSIACGRCGDAICPRCMVHAPVGVRCPDCGRSRPTPTFDVSPMFLARGIGAGLLVGIVGGIGVSVIVMLVIVVSAPVSAGGANSGPRVSCWGDDQHFDEQKARNAAKARSRIFHVHRLLAHHVAHGRNDG